MHYDVVIVGAGTAGSVLASRLSENPGRRVALVEAGADYPYFRDLPEAVKYLGSESAGPLGDDMQASDRLTFDWGFVARATDLRPRMKVPRGRIIGGSGSINGYAFLRGERSDFDDWAAMGNTEWAFDKVLPFLRRLEKDLDFHEEYHGSTGPLRISRVQRHNWTAGDHAFEEACLALGYPSCDDLNRPDATGVGPTPTTSQDGTRMSSARAYLPMARGRGNLDIIPNSEVRRVRIADGRAVGVELVDGHVIGADQVIVSAGSVKSPQILQLSGIGPAEALAALGVPVSVDLPGVGACLRDHPTVVMLWSRRSDAPSNDAPKSQQGSPRGSAGLRLRFTSPDSPVHNDSTIRSFGSAAMEGHPERAGMYNINVGLSLASSRGTVTLRSTDPTEAPAIDINFLDTEDDRRRMRAIVRITHELTAQTGMQKFVKEIVEPTPVDIADDAALDEWMARRVKTSHHLTTTCKMGPDSDREAVVDQFGRVYGVEGLRVADASIMPDCTRPNVNLTTTMIGERIAAFVEEGR